MKTIRVILTAVLLTLVGVVVLAAPVNKDENAKLEISESNDYVFDWSSELSDGRKIRQLAYKKQLDDGTQILAVEGYYSYVGPDGTKFTVIYYADETGYHPTVIFENQPSYTAAGRTAESGKDNGQQVVKNDSSYI